MTEMLNTTFAVKNLNNLLHDHPVIASEKKILDCIYAAGVDFITGVPDSEFKDLIKQLEESGIEQTYLLATREDNALALAAGAYLAGRQPLVFMESSGFGNIVDVLTSLIMIYEIPVVLFIAWAGYKGRDEPHHNIIGESIDQLLDSLRLPWISLELGSGSQWENAFLEAVETCQKVSGPSVILGIPAKLCKGEKNDERRNSGNHYGSNS